MKKCLAAVLALVLAAPSSAQQRVPVAPAAAYTDPVQYCRAVRNADSGEGGIRDRRYAGAPTPKSIVTAMREANVWWRCMDGRVYACAIGASGRGCQKWTTRKTATPSIARFCAENRNSDIVPNSDNDTIYSWKCRGAKPVLDQGTPTPRLDKRGYFTDTWKPLSQ